MKPEVILGICAFLHDSAAALFVGNQLVGSLEEEKLINEKHTGRFPACVIKWVLDRAGLQRNDVDCVAFYMDGRRLRQAAPRALVSGSPSLASFYSRIYRNHLARMDEVRREFPGAEIIEVPHHDCHALAAFHASGWDRAAALTIDSIGEGDSTVMYQMGPDRCRRCLELNDPASLGYVYGAITEHLGFRRGDEEGSVMALASYGDPERFRGTMHELLRVEADGFLVDPALIHDRARALQAGRRTALDLDRRTVLPRRDGEDLTAPHADLAAALQERTREVLIHLATVARRRTGERNLVLAGGVALNCVAVGALRRAGVFEEVFVPPAPGDSGTALGAALAVLRRRGTVASDIAACARVGISYSNDEITTALASAGLQHKPIADPVATAGELLEQGRLIGLFQGPAEVGPRALGARSVLALPTDAAVRDRVNRAVKFREWFRPCAPVLLRERVCDWFDGDWNSPYMSFAAPVRPEQRARIPAVVHVDGTARLQTVTVQDDPFLHALLLEVEARTGVPILLNTSLNLKGRPTAATLQSAIECFRASELDHLVIGPFLVYHAHRI